jgi:hypothetical protein
MCKRSILSNILGCFLALETGMSSAQGQAGTWLVAPALSEHALITYSTGDALIV